MYGNYPSNDRQIDNNYDGPRPNGVTYSRQVEYIGNDSKTRSGHCVEITLLVLTVIFIAASTTLGIVSTVLESWWIHKDESGTSNYIDIKIGLWKACVKRTSNADFGCKHYTDDNETSKSPYKDIDVLQYCMGAGTAICGIALIFVIISGSIQTCSKKASRICLYLVTFLTLVGVALYLVVIGYVLDTKEAAKLKPSWIVVNGLKEDLEYGIMFILSCIAAGCSGMSLILAGVLLFISDFDKDDANNDDRASDLGVERSNSFDYDHAYRVEQKKSHRNNTKHYMNHDSNGGVHMHKMNGYANHQYERPGYKTDPKIYQINDYSYRNMSYEDNSYLHPTPDYNRHHTFNDRKMRSHRKKRSTRKHKRIHQPYMSYGDQHRISQQMYNPNQYEDRRVKDRYHKSIPPPSQPKHPIGNSYLNGNIPVIPRNYPDYPDDIPETILQKPVSAAPPTVFQKQNIADKYDMYFDAPY